ncbi:MAG: hypothetical protein PHU77_05595 [Simplicispira sp.]|nr:hypothetical protein [Simplicispira sp.]
MQAVKPRATLRSFRALAFHGENRGESTGTEMRMEMQQEIELGVAVPSVPGGPIQVSVLIKLKATATNGNDAKEQATFAGDYEAKFYFATEVIEDQVTPLMDDSEYQYLLVAQAFPLAMTHFRRELQALGLDARQLPLGLP